MKSVLLILGCRYLISYLKYFVSNDCSIRSLRAVNPVALLGTFFTVHYALKTLHNSSSNSKQWAHTAANICIFPPLLFFSALFYTDVPSVFFVLLAFVSFCDSRVQGLGNTAGWPVLWQIMWGLVSLWFRQTNVFWVGVFPAGLAVVELARRAGKEKSEQYHGGTTFMEVVKQSWEKGLFYDPPVGDAWMEGLCTNRSSGVISNILTQTMLKQRSRSLSSLYSI